MKVLLESEGVMANDQDVVAESLTTVFSRGGSIVHRGGARRRDGHLHGDS